MDAALPSDGLTIGDVSDSTGVPAATLRSWESRHSFPVPMRLPRGHRRYTQRDVDAVLEVLRHRDAGLALEAAIRRAATQSHESRSIYAELRRGFPDLVPQVLSKRSLLALSRAIEDECCALAEQPLLFGSFQSGYHGASRARWIELARTARAAVVFANTSGGQEMTPGQPIEVPLAQEAPLNREWTVICDSPTLPACLVAVERPGQKGVPNRERRFEAVWTVDPQAVRHASRLAAGLADEYRPGWRGAELTVLGEEPPRASRDLRRACDLLNRMMGYLDSST